MQAQSRHRIHRVPGPQGAGLTSLTHPMGAERKMPEI